MRPAEIERLLEDMEPYTFFLPRSEHVTTDAPIIAIKTGETGYWPIFTYATAEELNKDNPPPEVLEAARAGSIFGWHAPIAQPAIEWVLAQRQPKE